MLRRILLVLAVVVVLGFMGGYVSAKVDASSGLVYAFGVTLTAAATFSVVWADRARRGSRHDR